MSIYRRLPITDAARALAMDRAALKISISAPADIVLSAQTQTRLATTRSAFNLNLGLRGQALSNQRDMTPDKDSKRYIAGLYISHFIQGLDKAALRGEPGFTLAQRAYFLLDATNDTLPPLETDDQVFLWGNRVITGNATRIAAGKPVMPFPLIADVSTKYNSFVTVFGDYNLLKKAYDDAQEAISNMREEVDSLILRMWNEVETAYSEEEAPSKRRNSREWGVVYVITGDEPLSPDEFSIAGTLTDSVTGEPIENAAVIVQAATEIIVLTDAQGKYYVPKLPVGAYNLVVHKDGFEEYAIPGVAVTEDAVTMLNIQLNPIVTGGVSGTVFKGGVGISATVIVEGTAHTTQTDGTGHFVLQGIEPGQVNVRATSNANPADTMVMPAFITAGGVIELNFNLP